MGTRACLGALVLLACGASASPLEPTHEPSLTGDPEPVSATPPADPAAAARLWIDHVRVATEARLTLDAQRAAGETGSKAAMLPGSVLDHVLGALAEARDLAAGLGAEDDAASLERARATAAVRRGGTEDERLAALGPAYAALAGSVAPITEGLEPASRACLRASHEAADAWVRLDQALYRQRLERAPAMRAEEERAQQMQRLADAISMRIADLDGEMEEVNVAFGREVYADVIEDLTELRALVGPVRAARVDAMIERARATRTLAQIEAATDLADAVADLAEDAAASEVSMEDDGENLPVLARIAAREPQELAEQAHFVEPRPGLAEWAAAAAGVDAVVAACGDSERSP